MAKAQKMSQDEVLVSENRWRGAVSLILFILVPFLFLCWVRLESAKPHYELETDSYYHVMMADLFPEACLAKTFPYLNLSVWKDNFYNKELGFHMVLSVVRRYAQMTGLPLSPPFHLPALLFGLLTISTFAYAVASLNIPRGYLITWLFVGLSPFFTYRLLMLRPQHLALIFMILYCLYLARSRNGGSLWNSFFFGWLAAYSYSQPHFLLLPAIVYGWLCRSRLRGAFFTIPAALIAGIVVGFTLHPQFPNTFIVWKIQSVDVILQSITQKLYVYTGTELARPDQQFLVENAALYALAILNAWALHCLWKARSRVKLSPDTIFFFILQAVTIGGSLLSRRAVEYACPFTLITSGLLIRDWIAAGLFNRWKREKLLRAPALTLLIGCAVLGSGVYSIKSLSKLNYPEFREFSEWSGKTLPDGTPIANLVWGDFPMLFFAAPQFQYSMGLDPMFGYMYAPERVETLEKFRTGQLSLSPEEVSKLTGARFAFVSRRVGPLAKLLIQRGFVIVYRGSDGWLFDLKPEPVQ